MEIQDLHGWQIPISEAVELQKKLAAQVEARSVLAAPRLVAGLDCGYSAADDRLYAAVVLCRLPARPARKPEDIETLEEHVVESKPLMPYVPGLLSFREIPPLLECLKKLRTDPEAVLVDGQGIAHPRRLGVASHLGLFINIPTVGCAKSILVGTHGKLAEWRGSRSPLVHRGEKVGVALRTRDGVMPVYVSVGHLVDLAGAIRLVLRSSAGYRLPEPARRAHHLATMARKAGEERQ